MVRARRALEIVLAVFLIGTIIGAAIGQPVFLSYVETESMSPTLEPDDGFIAIPALVSDVDRGDIVVFDAKYIHDGGLVTHRVIDHSSAGYITRGDANPFPDQSVGEPAVSDRQIVATALQINGEIVVIPELGKFAKSARETVDMGQRHLAAISGVSLFRGPEGLIFIVSSLSVLLYGSGAFTRATNRRPSRDNTRSTGQDPRIIAGLLVLILISGVTMSMVLGSQTQQYDVRADVTENATYMMANGLVPTTVFLEAQTDGIAPRESVIHLEPNEERNVSVQIEPGDDGIGAIRGLSEYRYPSVVPTVMLQQLHMIHPWLARLSVDFVLAVTFYLACIRLVGTGRIRTRSRNRNLSITTRIRRLYRNE